MKYLPYLLLWLSSFPLFAQVKYEKERSINAQTVPETSRKIVDALTEVTKIKWYQEQQVEGISYEAKYKLNGRHYSVEFSQDGVLEDAEIELKWMEVPQPAAEAMKAHFDNTYLRYRVRKVQEQFSGGLPAIQVRLQQMAASEPAEGNGNANGDAHIPGEGMALVLRYEVVVQVLTEQGPALHEVLFDEQGLMLQTTVILLRNTDNLAY